MRKFLAGFCKGVGVLGVMVGVLAGPAVAASVGTSLRQTLTKSTTQMLPVVVTFSGQAELPGNTGNKANRRALATKGLQVAAEHSQGKVKSWLRNQGQAYRQLWLVNGLAFAATPAMVAELANQPEVERIDLDRSFSLSTVQAAVTAAPGWNVAAVHAPALWSLGYTGQNVTVAVLDSGVDLAHADLTAKWLGGAAGWFDPYTPSSQPYDVDGHGTQVTGIILGGETSGTAIGVAPDARWVAAKIFRDDGIAVNSEILRAMQWVLDPDGNAATADSVADVINSSWGFEQLAGECDPIFATAVSNLRAAGIAVIFAAGNTGPSAGSDISPANNPGSLAVGSVDEQKTVSLFSSRGPSACDNSLFPELVAPGENIYTTDLTLVGLPQYMTVSGTSFAAPHAAGVAALLIGAAPERTLDEVENALLQGAADLGPPGGDNDYGYGLLDALASYSLLTGTPFLTVTDPVAPGDDRQLDFGSVAPGGQKEYQLLLTNSGTGTLSITGIEQPAAPFSVVSDACSGVNLGASASCPVQLRFAPPSLGTSSATLAIHSTAPQQAVVLVALQGQGNTPPPAPQLVFPGNGAGNLGSIVTLQWLQAPDADGDSISHQAYLSTSADFSAAVVRAPGTQTGVLVGGLLLGGGVLLRRGRRRAALLVALLLLVACQHGGGDAQVAAGTGQVTYSVTKAGLQPGTTYYWKIASTDSRGARTESAIWSFTTAP